MRNAQDIRAELASAHEFYQSQIEASTKAAAPAIQVPAGWALVRTEPTVEMLDAGINEIDYDGNEVADNVRNVWLAMIEAARKDSPKGGSDAPTYTTGHCENRKKPSGCPLHNLQCGYPQCDRRQAGDAEVQP